MKFKIKYLIFIILLAIGIYAFSPLGIHSVNANQTETNFKPRRYDEIKDLKAGQYKFRIGDFWGIYDNRGIVIYPQFTEIINMTNLYAVKRDGRWGAIDSYGRIKIPIEWDSISELTFDEYKVGKNGYFGWITKEGKVIELPKYTYLEKLNTELFSACAPESGCGVLTDTGETFLPLTHDGIIGWLNRTYFSIYKNGVYGIIDFYGNKITDCKFTEIYNIDENVIYTQDNKLRGLASLDDGRIIIAPMFENIVALEQKGYYKIKSDGNWGVVNYDGEVIYPCKYGTFEINRIMKKYPINTKYRNIYDYNYYHSKLLTAEYYLRRGLIGVDAKRNLREVLSSNNNFSELKTKADNLMQKYGISKSSL